MRNFRAELHVHTVLSPCAGVEMIPPLIVRAALEHHIHLIAITDHNHSANAAAVMQAAEGTSLHVLPGMELQTQEDVHLLCLFDTLAQVSAWQKRVDQLLPDTPNNIEYFGEQFVVDHEGEFIRREERLLINSAHIELEHAIAEVSALGGLALPAHVDRKANGLFEILGFLPPGIQAVEISRHISPTAAQQKYPQLKDRHILQSGDVHYLDDFLGASILFMESACIAEIQQALFAQNGRSIQIP